jgi:hypothetical protein
METPEQEKLDLLVSRDKGLRCLEERNYEGVVKALQESALSDPSGESQALMGLAHYQRREHEQAAPYEKRGFVKHSEKQVGPYRVVRYQMEITTANNLVDPTSFPSPTNA